MHALRYKPKLPPALILAQAPVRRKPLILSASVQGQQLEIPHDPLVARIKRRLGDHQDQEGTDSQIRSRKDPDLKYKETTKDQLFKI